MKKRKASHIPKNDKPKWKFKLFLLLLVVFGALTAINPRILPAQVQSHKVTRKFYTYRDSIAVKLPRAFRPAGVVSVEPLVKPTTPGQGYAPTERRKMEDLIDKGTMQ